MKKKKKQKSFLQKNTVQHYVSILVCIMCDFKCRSHTIQSRPFIIRPLSVSQLLAVFIFTSGYIKLSTTAVKLPDFKCIASNSKEEDNTWVLMFSGKTYTYTHIGSFNVRNEFVDMWWENEISYSSLCMRYLSLRLQFPMRYYKEVFHLHTITNAG